MGVTPQTPNDPFYMSAPASPKRISLEGSCFFYSVPTNPTRRNLQAAYDLGTEPATPKTCEDSSSHVDEFNFETNHRFDVGEYEAESVQKSESQVEEPHQNHVRKESLPAMAFAGELFCDGEIMPLKPPPRLQYPNYKKFHKRISTLSSPRSPTGVPRLPFQRRSLWNDDFDPFMVALENVKEEKVGKSQPKSHRRSRSMSTCREIGRKGANYLLGSSQQKIKQMGLILQTKQSEPNLNKSMESNGSALLMYKDSLMGRQEEVKQEKKRSLRLTQLKGVLLARRAMIVKVVNENPRKPSSFTRAVEAGESAKECGVTCTNESKIQKVKNFPFRNGSMGK